MQNVSCKLITDRFIPIAVLAACVVFFIMVVENCIFLDYYYYEHWIRNDDVVQHMYLMEKKSERLIEQLSDKNPKTRWNAAANLGVMKSELAVPHLINSLKNDKNPQVRVLSAWALGRIKSTESVPQLISAIQDKNVDVVTFAIWALGEIRSKDSVKELENLVTIDRETGKLQLLIDALAKINNLSSVSILGSLIDNPDPNIRRCLADKLKHFKTQESADILIKMLKDENSDVICEALISLREFRDGKVTDSISGLMLFNDPRVREQAKIILEESDSLNASHYPQSFNLREAKKQHYLMLSEYSRPDLVLGDIADMNPEDSHDLGTLPIQLGRVFDLEEVINDLNSEYSDFRSDAVWRMGNSGDTRVVPYLISALDDDDYNVRWNAAKSLGKLNDKRAVEPLIAKMDDPEKDVREDVVEALGRLKDSRAEKVLLRSYKDEPEGYVRAEIIIALEMTGQAEKNMDLIISALRDTSPHVKANAVLVLGCRQDKKYLSLLMNMGKEKDADIHEAVARALKSINGNEKIDIKDHYHED